MKKMKKLMALLLSVIMVLAMSVTAFAAGGTGSIVLNGTKAPAPGKTVNVEAYRMFSAEKTGETVEYTLEKTFENFFTSNDKYGCKDKTGTELSNAAVDYVSTIQRGEAAGKVTFVKEVLTWILQNKASVESVKTSTASIEGSTTISNLPYGLYFVYPQGASNTAAGTGTEKTQGLIVTLVDPTTTIDLKSQYPTVDKTIVDPDPNEKPDYTVGGDLNLGVNDNWEGKHDMELDSLAARVGASGKDFQVGDEVTFQLQAKVPDMTGFTDYKFKFHDTLSEGLTFKHVMKVSVGGKDLNPKTEYTATLVGQKLTIELIDFYNKYKNQAGADIVITYTAVLNEKAAVGMNPNTNKASVEFSNDPSTSTETDTSTDDVAKVYTFDFTIFKFHMNNTAEEALANATFQLYTDEKCQNMVKLKKVAGQQAWVANKENQTNEDIVTDGTGLAQIKGLKAGTYYLKETIAPNGYHKLTSPIKVVITPTYAQNGDLEKYEVAYTYNGTETKVENANTSSSPQIKVENKSGTILPNTGGMGTVIFTVVGIVLILGVGVSFVISRRRKAE